MDSIETLHAFSQIKMLADVRRMKILCLLMASPTTLTQLARTPQAIPGLGSTSHPCASSRRSVEMVEVRKTGKVTEKYYRTKGAAFLLQQMVLPKTKKSALRFSSSNDLALPNL